MLAYISRHFLLLTLFPTLVGRILTHLYCKFSLLIHMESSKKNSKTTLKCQYKNKSSILNVNSKKNVCALTQLISHKGIY